MGAASDIEDDELEFEDENQYGQNDGQADPMAQSVSANADIGDDLLSFANQCCEEFGLTDALKDDVLKSCKLPTQFLMVRLYSRVLSFGKDVKKNTVDGFLESSTFKNHISRRILCSLLDPNLPFYVQGTTSRFVKHIIDNPGAYNIPEAVRASFMHGKLFTSGISESASSHRSEIKHKLDKSIEDAVDIYTTCHRLYPQGYQCTEDHARRMAFLRMYLVEYNGINTWTAKTKTSFWEWVDTKLVKFRKKSKQEQETSLRSNLKKDKRRFPIPVDGQSSFPTVVKPQDWQADIGVAVLAMAEQVDSVSRQRAPRPRTATSRSTPAVGAVPNARAPGNGQDNNDPEHTDDQLEEEPATGTSEPEDGQPTGWGHDNPPNGAAMDVDWRPVGPQAGHAASGQHHDGGGSDFTGAIRTRDLGLSRRKRPNPIGRGSVPLHRAIPSSHLGLGNSAQNRLPVTPQARSSASQSSSRFGTPTPHSSAIGEDDRTFYDPLSSGTGAATLGLD